jgi:HlyD family secretion protein
VSTETATETRAPRATTPADDALAALRRKPRRRWWLFALVPIVVGAGVALWMVRRAQPEPSHYLTGAASTGDVVAQIEATGTVQPITQVQVGSQVSGRILALHADFNDVVHAGDLLAELDPTPFRARVAQARAALASAIAGQTRAQAELGLAQRNATRAEQMRERQLNAQSDLDASVAARESAAAQVGVARASVAQARAALDSAQTDLAYTRVMAPIDGIVVTRSIEVGQTVAASLQAPVLFLIVDDLARVQVVGDVDEAEIGKLSPGMAVEVRVDAFSDDVFPGRVRELRLGSTTTQGVVTYPAVIDVDNSARKLRPGMTATIAVTTAEHRGVLRVPNAALRFRPRTTEGATTEAPGARASGGARGARGGRSGAGNRGRVYVLDSTAPGAVPRAVQVTIGISDAAFTEVSSPELRAGAQVVLDDVGGAAEAATGGGAAAGSGSGSARGSSKRPPGMF